MSAITTTLTVLLLASGASAALFVDYGGEDKPSLPSLDTPLPPGLPDPDTILDPKPPADEETYEDNETYEEETDEYEEDAGCPDDYQEYNDTYQDEYYDPYYTCGTFIDEHHEMIGPTTQSWSWKMDEKPSALFVSFYANGMAQGTGVLPCQTAGSTVTLFDGRGQMIATAKDQSSLGLQGFLELDFESWDVTVPGQWSLEFDGCYVAGMYDVRIEAGCTTYGDAVVTEEAEEEKAESEGEDASSGSGSSVEQEEEHAEDDGDGASSGGSSSSSGEDEPPMLGLLDLDLGIL